MIFEYLSPRGLEELMDHGRTLAPLRFWFEVKATVDTWQAEKQLPSINSDDQETFGKIVQEASEQLAFLAEPMSERWFFDLENLNIQACSAVAACVQIISSSKSTDEGYTQLVWMNYLDVRVRDADGELPPVFKDDTDFKVGEAVFRLRHESTSPVDWTALAISIYRWRTVYEKFWSDDEDSDYEVLKREHLVALEAMCKRLRRLQA